MRPENLAQYIGQQHLLAAGKPLPRAIEAGHLHSMILWGPPGTGKTTLAEVIARYANADVERISAVTSGVKEIREAIERARQNRNAGRRTILFVDEVHRFNKSQQDAFLPHIEDGTIFFIGATTENPSFELNSALLSRARVYLLKSLTTEDIEKVLTQAMNDKARGYGGQDIVLPDDTRRAIAELVNGDARRALNTLEMMVDMAEVDDAGKRVLKQELLTEIAGERSARFDNKGDRFYDLISALHKSVRGSAPTVSTNSGQPVPELAPTVNAPTQKSRAGLYIGAAVAIAAIAALVMYFVMHTTDKPQPVEKQQVAQQAPPPNPDLGAGSSASASGGPC